MGRGAERPRPASTAATVSNNDVSVYRTPRGLWDPAPGPGIQQAGALTGQQRAITSGQVLKLLQGRTDQGWGGAVAAPGWQYGVRCGLCAHLAAEPLAGGLPGDAQSGAVPQSHDHG